MKVVAVVPMKMNNRRLPGKNTRCFTNGKPLFTYILETLKQVSGIDEVFVYCSDSSVQELLPEGAQYMSRPTTLDLDTTSMNEVLQSFAGEVPADVYVMTHATAPFVEPSSIRKGVEAVASGRYDSAFAVKKVQDFFWKDGRPLNYALDSIPRTQDLDPLFQETSGFYIYRREVMVESGRRIGDNPLLVEVGEIEAIDIDEAVDFDIADAVFNHIVSKGKGGAR